MTPPNPCHGCTERVPDPNCHMTCPKYIEFHAVQEERYRERALKVQVAEVRSVSYHRMEREQIMKRKKGGRR